MNHVLEERPATAMPPIVLSEEAAAALREATRRSIASPGVPVVVPHMVTEAVARAINPFFERHICDIRDARARERGVTWL